MKNLVFILIFLISKIGFTQIPEIVLQQCYGTSEPDYDFAISETDNGYMFAIEVSAGDGLLNYHGLTDIWIISTDSIGTLLWEKCFGGSNYDSPRKIIRLIQNEYYILGGTKSTDGDVKSYNHGDSEIWIIKINGQGNLLWEKCYGSPGTDEPRDMILTQDNGFALLSRISSSGGDISQYYGLYDNWILKCDSIGNIEWEKTLGNEGLDNGISMIINSQGNIMMIGAVQLHGGMVECYPDGAWGDVWLVEMDLQGNIVSQHCYGGSDYDVGINILETENSYILSCYTTSNDGDVTGLHGPPGGPPNGHGDIWLVNLNKNYEILWQKCLGGYDQEDPEFITETDDDGYVIIGDTFSNDGDVSGNHSNPGTDTDIWVVKLNEDGVIEWQHCFGGFRSERLENPHTILKKSDYDYVVASSTNYGPSYDVACTPTGGNPDRDAWIFEIKTEDTTGIPVQQTENDALKVYPNPAKDYIIFEIPYNLSNNAVIPNPGAGKSAGVRNPPERTGNVKAGDSSSRKAGFGMTGADETTVVIMNIYGQEVATKQITSEKTVFDLRQFREGIYFYWVEFDGFNYSGKIVVQR